MVKGKYLVVVSGPTTDTDRMYESFVTHIASGLDFDVICSTDNSGSGDKWVSGSKYLVQVPSDLSDQKHVTDYLSDFGLDSIAISDFDQRYSTIFGGVTNSSASGFYGLALVRRYLIYKFIVEFLDASLYDRMIILRPDMLFLRKVDFGSVGLDDIVIPLGEDYGGLNDRFIACSFQTGILLLSQLSSLTNPEFRANLLSLSNVNPERFLYEVVRNLTTCRIVRIPPVGFLLRSIKNQRSTWSTGMYCKRINACVKSPFEYESAMYVAKCGTKSIASVKPPLWFRLLVWFPSPVRQYSWILRTWLVSFLSRTRLHSSASFVILASLLRVSVPFDNYDTNWSDTDVVWKSW
jgi:hypothetical protein